MGNFFSKSVSKEENTVLLPKPPKIYSKDLDKIQCKSFVDGESEITNYCDIIEDNLLLGQYSEQCMELYNWIVNNNTEFIGQEDFDVFIKSGTFWMKHLIHFSKCTKSDNNYSIAFKSFCYWKKSLDNCYNNFIYRPYILYIKRQKSVSLFGRKKMDN